MSNQVPRSASPYGPNGVSYPGYPPFLPGPMLRHIRDTNDPHNTAGVVKSWVESMHYVNEARLSQAVGGLMPRFTASSPISISGSVMSLMTDVAPTRNSGRIVLSGDLWEYLRDRFRGGVHYRGQVPTYADLPESPEEGDLWNVQATDENYIWNGTAWDKLGSVLDANSKVDKPSQATYGHLVVLTSTGNILDAGVSPDDFVRASGGSMTGVLSLPEVNVGGARYLASSHRETVGGVEYVQTFPHASGTVALSGEVSQLDSALRSWASDTFLRLASTATATVTTPLALASASASSLSASAFHMSDPAAFTLGESRTALADWVDARADARSVSLDRLVAGTENPTVPAALLPSYVDDVLEYPDYAHFPAQGESGKIYVDLEANLTYRWTGSQYTEISKSLALGETALTAYRGDRGKAAYEHATNDGAAVSASGFLKVTVNSAGHVTATEVVTAADVAAAGGVTSVNGVAPDEGGDVPVTRVPLADNLYSPQTETDAVAYLRRTTAGSQSVASGDSELSRVLGNVVLPQRTPASLAVADQGEAVAASSGTATVPQGEYDLRWRGSSWYLGETGVEPQQLSAYALEWTGGRPLAGSAIAVEVGPGGSVISVSTTHPQKTLSVVSAARFSEAVGGEGGAYVVARVLIARIPAGTEAPGLAVWKMTDATHFVTVASATLDECAETLGVEMTGSDEPDDGDMFDVTSVAPSLGTMTVAKPTAFRAVGFNAFDRATMYDAQSGVATVPFIGGLTGGWTVSGGGVTAVAWTDGTQLVPLSPDPSSGIPGFPVYNHASDGWLAITASDPDTLCVHPRWSGRGAWTEDGQADWQPYAASVIEIPQVKDYGLAAVGSVRDEIDFRSKVHVQRVGMLPYSAENLASLPGIFGRPVVEGTDYVYDSTYIFYVLATPVTTPLPGSASGAYQANDWGTEEFVGSPCAVYARHVYGSNLRGDLRTDTLRKSAQTLSQSEKAQVWQNIGLGGIGEILDFINGD